MRCSVIVLALSVWIILASTGANGAVLTVITANPTGPGSLGQAIQDANALPGADEIVFAIPGSGIQKIDLSGDLGEGFPALRDPVVIDGYTQPGARPNTLSVGNNAVILIQLDGGGPTSTSASGLRFLTTDSIVRGLSFTGFSLEPFDPENPERLRAAIHDGPDFDAVNKGNSVEGNFIGLSPDGQVSGSYVGVLAGRVIGGSTPEKRNVIAGNQIGVLTYGSGTISNNYIGVDPSGLKQGYGNHCGILVVDAEPLIMGNVISNNDIGIEPIGGIIRGNLIGPLADGSASFGNQIGIKCESSRMTFGGLGPGEGNVIAFNRKGLVLQRRPTAPPGFFPRGSRILSNLFYGNGLVDIDLADDGPTTNDFQDADDGENRLQNYPVISEVVRSTGSTTVKGGLNSRPATTFTLQFFANGASRTAPQTLLGTETVKTNSVGDAPFEFTFPIATSSDQFITATATDPDGNTSEFFPPRGKVELANISTRGFVGIGERVLIGGFISTGSSRTLLIRALGPSLNVNGALADPRLVVRERSGRVLAENDNWKLAGEQRIRETGLAPLHDLEAAVVVGFDFNRRHTVEVSGADGGIGIGTVEVYALKWEGQFAPDQLLNVSTRGHVGTGDNVLIGGMILQGSAAQKVIVRAIGPELAEAGVSMALQDPTLELRDGEGNLLVANDDWRSDQEQEIIATGVAPKDDRSAAIVARLLPTVYTAIVRGKDNSTGIALVEFYKLD